MMYRLMKPENNEKDGCCFCENYGKHLERFHESKLLNEGGQVRADQL